jgi:chromosomal replication initiation ATPase DnaA
MIDVIKTETAADVLKLAAETRKRMRARVMAEVHPVVPRELVGEDKAKKKREKAARLIEVEKRKIKAAAKSIEDALRISAVPLPNGAEPRVTTRYIWAMVSLEFNIPMATLMGNSRMHDAVQARMAAYWLCRKLTLDSLPMIGKWFPIPRHHTTVLSGIRSADKLRAASPVYAKLLDDLAEKIKTEWRAAYEKAAAGRPVTGDEGG